MAVRGSFQKRQKEAARREKRQLKLDRRQGRQPAPAPTISSAEIAENKEPADPANGENDGPSVQAE